MSEHLDDVLNQYLDWLRDNKHPAADALQPGLSQSETDHLAAGLPFTLTDEIQTFYRWRNGLPNERTSFIPNFSFLPLEHAVRDYHTIVEVTEQVNAMAKNDPRVPVLDNFNPTWFPLFVLSAPDYYFVDCSDKKTKRGNVIEVMEGAYPKVVSKNLTKMMEKLLASCRAGAYSITEEGEFEASNLPASLKRRPKVINPELEASLLAAAHDWVFIESPEIIKRVYGTEEVRTEILEMRIEGTGLDTDPVVGRVRTCNYISHPKIGPEMVDYPAYTNNRYLLIDGQWVRA